MQQIQIHFTIVNKNLKISKIKFEPLKTLGYKPNPTVKQVAMTCKYTASKWINCNPVGFERWNTVGYCQFDLNICNTKVSNLK